MPSAWIVQVICAYHYKWMLAPKGSAFLYMRREVQELVEPLIVSWGYNPTPEAATGSRFLDLLQWTGTKDPSAALTVPAAIQFMEANDWETVRSRCHDLLRQALERIGRLTGLAPVVSLESKFYGQMAVAPLPFVDPVVLKNRLYEEHKIEVPVIVWQERLFIRISVQAYNDQSDIDALLHALAVILPHKASLHS